MVRDSKISWTGDTWNPLRGCSRHSPGCQHCYAETIAERFSGEGQPFEGYAVRGKGWTRKVSLLPDVLNEALGWRENRLKFISMSDPFHENLTNEEIAALFGVMSKSKATFQILTKRSERALAWFEWVARYDTHMITMPFAPKLVCHMFAQHAFANAGLNTKYVNHGMGTCSNPREWPLPNVWIGASVENQEWANKRIPALLDTPAVVRFLSCEPLLGEIDLEHIEDVGGRVVNALLGCSATARGRNKRLYPGRVHWVIAGAESGHERRPCDVAWLRSLRDQVLGGPAKFFLKQAEDVACAIDASKRPTISELYPIRIGAGSRRKSGNMLELPYLDGQQYAAMPEWNHAT